MKKLLLFLLFDLCFFVVTQAQTVDFAESVIEKYYQYDPALPNQDVEAHVDLTNLADRAVTYHWVREEVLLPSGWGSAICDRVCYFENVSEKDLILEPNETLNFIVHAYSHQNPGDSAVIKVTIYELGDETNKDEVVFNFGSNLSSSKDLKKGASISLYPNPTVDYFSLSDAEDVANIELYSIVGSKVKSFDARNQNYFDVSELHRGIYLARLRTDDGQILKTVRINKK